MRLVFYPVSYHSIGSVLAMYLACGQVCDFNSQKDKTCWSEIFRVPSISNPLPNKYAYAVSARIPIKKKASDEVKYKLLYPDGEGELHTSRLVCKYMYHKITMINDRLKFSTTQIGGSPPVVVLHVQGWAKEWALGCVKPASWLPPAAGGEFTQPRAHSFAHLCTRRSTPSLTTCLPSS